MKKIITLLSKASLCAALLSFNAHATTVLIKTNLGDFEAELFDTQTPKTVDNFLAYVNKGSYNNAIFHRSIKGFIAQTGGFTYQDSEHDVTKIVPFAAVANEPVFSNVRGTLAMAKLGGDPNSATSQWFVNIDNNASNLDNQNGGFTVFGKVSEQGMEIIDTINNLTTYNLGSPTFAETPLQSVPGEDDEQVLTAEHLVLIESITVINEEADTAATLPPLSTQVADKDTESDSSGGSFAWLLALFAGSIAVRYKK